MKLYKKLQTNKVFKFNLFWVMGSYNFENFGRFGWKNCQNRKIVNFLYFTKIDIGQAQNDIESWNLAKLCLLMLSKKWSRLFLIFYVFFEILPNLSKILSKFWKMVKFSTNLAKFQKLHKISIIAVTTFYTL